MITTYFLNCLMGNVFGTQTTPTLPERFFIGLSTTAPLADGSNVSEPSDDSYERIELASLSAPSDGTITNTEDILFPAAATSWGYVSHYVVYDERIGGNLLLANGFYDSSRVHAGRAVRIKSGTLSFNLKNPDDYVSG